MLGTGTALDTARLRYLLGEYFSVDPRNVHAYVMGEHGDSEFVPWSQAMVATKPILDIFRSRGVTEYQKDLDHISEEVRNAAQKIISAKKSTYYGIGMAMVRITPVSYTHLDVYKRQSVAHANQPGSHQRHLSIYKPHE